MYLNVVILGPWNNEDEIQVVFDARSEGASVHEKRQKKSVIFSSN